MKEVKIKGVGKLRCRVYKREHQRNGFRRFVKTCGVLDAEQFAYETGIPLSTLSEVVGEIVRVVRAGYEVRLGEDKENCIRFYPMLDNACKKMQLISQTIGDVRNSLDDVKFSLYTNNGEEVDDVAAEKMVSEKARDYAKYKNEVSVTPDTMVTCPNCGTGFRVGKALTRQ